MLKLWLSSRVCPLFFVLKFLLFGSKLSQPCCSLLQTTVTEDFSHLPPEQRRKRLQQKLDDICKELQKEVDQRCVCCSCLSALRINNHLWDVGASGNMHAAEMNASVWTVYSAGNQIWLKVTFPFFACYFLTQRGPRQDERCLWEKSSNGRPG